MLDSKMNAEQSGDVRFDLSSFVVPKEDEEDEVVDEAEDYITEAYVSIHHRG